MLTANRSLLNSVHSTCACCSKTPDVQWEMSPGGCPAGVHTLLSREVSEAGVSLKIKWSRGDKSYHAPNTSCTATFGHVKNLTVRLSPCCRRQFRFFCSALGTEKWNPDPFNYGYRWHPTTPTDYNGVHRVSVTVSVILTETISENSPKEPLNRGPTAVWT